MLKKKEIMYDYTGKKLALSIFRRMQFLKQSLYGRFHEYSSEKKLLNWKKKKTKEIVRHKSVKGESPQYFLF